MNTSALPRSLTKKDVAAVLSVSVRKVDELRKAKEIRWFMVGGQVRFEAVDVSDYINRRKSRLKPFSVHFPESRIEHNGGST